MTAIEWLLENLISEPCSEEHFKHNSECWNKAEEMEKDEKHAEYMRGWKDGYVKNENYKNTKE